MIRILLPNKVFGIFLNLHLICEKIVLSIKYLIKKLLYGIFVLWGVVSLVFFLFNILPDDPARLTLGQRSDIASIENVRKELNLDKPMGQRYLLYLNDLSPISIHNYSLENKIKNEYFWKWELNSDYLIALKKPYLGRSYQSKRLVWDLITDHLPGTAVLALAAIIIASIFGIGLGVLAALKKDTFLDSSAILASVAGISTPSFFAGLLIAYIFGYWLRPYTGLNMTGSLWEYDFNGQPSLQIKNLILPAITLGIRPLAIIAQLTRSSLLDVLSQDYIRTAYSKGLSKAKVVWKHALPNAMNPVITAISGWLAELLAGSFFVEFVFSWKGIGKLTVDALEKFDFPVVMGILLLTAAIFVFINLLTDFIYKWLDPRVKLQ